MAIPGPSTSPDEADRAVVAIVRRFLGTSQETPRQVLACDPQAVVDAAVRLGVVRHVDLALKKTEKSDNWHSRLTSALGPAIRNHLGAAIKLRHDARLVIGALQGAGIPHVPFKGPFLSMDLYGDPLLRKARDIDIVLTGGRTDLAAACEALVELGYRLPHMHPALLDYCLTEKSGITLRSKGRGGVDVHHGSYHDLPPTAFADAASRALHVEDEGQCRLAFTKLDLLMMLAAHYWLTPGDSKIRWLFDCAVLLRDPETFHDGWMDRMEEWHVSFLFAAVFEAARHELWIEPATPSLTGLKLRLRRKERDVCERITHEGPENLPDGLVLKIHRLHLPWRRRLRAVRKFLWPHPGLVVFETGIRHGMPDPFQRLVFVARRLVSALRLR